MSSVYVQEPATTGKVLIETSYGELEVELWCKEAPQACRTFIQLAMEGYYDETVMHRLIPGFIIQGGDPVASGLDVVSEEAVCEPYKVEQHSRLSFTRRGLLGMAAVTDDGKCTTEFFFTLSTTTTLPSELDRKHTLFGRIVGDTVYNLLRMGDLETESGTDRPICPPKITGIRVLTNPFEDIELRELPQVRRRREAKAAVEAAKKKGKKADGIASAVAVRNRAVLSFCDEEEDDEDGDGGERTAAPMLSSHDMLNDPRLSKQTLSLDATVKESVKETIKPVISGETEYEKLKQAQKSNLSQIEQNILSVQQEIRQMDTSVVSQSDAKTTMVKGKKRSLLEEQREAYKRARPNAVVGKRRKDAVEDVNTLLTLNAFREKLLKMESDDPSRLPTSVKLDNTPSQTAILDICKLHGLVNCLSCRDTFGVSADTGGGEEGWLMHRLVFDKEAGYREVREDLTNLVVIDPREKTKSLVDKKSR